MQIISRRARLVCVTIATLTSATILAGTVLGLTTPSTPGSSAQATWADHVRVTMIG